MVQFVTSGTIEVVNKCLVVIAYLVVLKFNDNVVDSHPNMFNGHNIKGTIEGPFGLLRPNVKLTEPANLKNKWVKQFVDNFDMDNTKTWRNVNTFFLRNI